MSLCRCEFKKFLKVSILDVNFVKNIALFNFRSYEKHNLSFMKGPILLYGPNGVGKTNILEAISLLSPGRGMRGALSKDMEHHFNNKGWKINSVIEASGRLQEVNIKSDSLGKRNLRIDEKASSQISLGKILKVVWLTPMMDRIWLESSGERRRFLDRIVMNFEPVHANNCSMYEKTVQQRNRLLKDRENNTSWYLALEKLMAKLGYEIDQARRRVIERLYAMQLIISEKSNIDFPIANIELTTKRIESADALGDLLAQDRNSDMLAGRTLNGPHRSDLYTFHEKKSIEAKNCSTGEQKSLLLSIFIANAFALKEFFGATPVLLLDEICSHLDSEKLKFLFNEIETLKAQTFFTGTECASFDIIKERLQAIQLS